MNIVESSDGKFIYIIGIIDTLTYFGNLKCMEYLGRRYFQSKNASCVPPPAYASRFVDFMGETVFSKVVIENRATWGDIMVTQRQKEGEDTPRKSNFHYQNILE